MKEAAEQVAKLVASMGCDKGLEEAVRQGLTQRLTFGELYAIVANDAGVETSPADSE